MNHDPKHAVTPEVTAEQKMTTAMEDHAAGRFSDAGATYTEALRENPNDARTLMLSGAVELEQGRADQALGLLERAVAADPFLAEAKAMLALTYKTLHRLSEAKQTYTAALQIKPDYAQAWTGLGEVLCELGEAQHAYACFGQAFARQPHVAVNALYLGQVAQAMGQLEDALNHFEQAIAIDPEFEPALTAAGILHVGLGNHAKAVERLEKCLGLGIDKPEVLSRLGGALHGVGRTEEGIGFCERALAAQPNDPSTLANLALMLRHKGRLQEAETKCMAALQLKPEFPTALNTLGLIHKDKDDIGAAETMFSRAVQLDPQHFHAWNNLGACYRATNRLQPAVTAYERALAINPNYDAALNNLGGILMVIDKEGPALSYFQRGVEAGSTMVELYANYATCLERLNKLEALESLIECATANGVAEHELVLPRALLAKRTGDNQTARTLLEGNLGFQENTHGKAFRIQLLTDICDKLGHHEAAFVYAQEGNRLALEQAQTEAKAQAPDGAPEWSAERYRTRLDHVTAAFTPTWVEGWTETPAVDQMPTPHFMVGFPRSGTTLLDTFLRGHPDIQVMEEIPTTHKLILKLEQELGGYPAALADLKPAQIEDLRATYFDEFAKAGGDVESGKLIIDKLPLNLVDAGLIHRLFPEAKFLLVTRHPCDCVLSCFMQHFALNDPMANFLELETTAQVYDKAFHAWTTYTQTLPLHSHQVRYEDVVENAEDALRPILEFFGLPWDARILSHQETARKRERINTPSYSQVSQPIYRSARGRWENYRGHMEPVIPLLRPWAEKFGYEV